MIRAAFLLLLVACGAEAQRFQDRYCDRPERAQRGRNCGGYAFFEAFPDNGAGTTAACDGATPSGAKGEAISFVRASAASCLKGNTTTGIADGELVKLTSGQPAIMPGGDGTGPLGIVFEPTRTNDCLRGEELCNASWTDTATCASDAVAGPFGTTTMDRLTDGSGAALQGATQSITTNAANKHAWSCFIKAGTATSATISMVGTGNGTGDCSATVTGLSTTTSKRVSCVSPAAYTGSLTSVTVSVLVGTVASDTGSITVEACQHEDTATTGVSSYIPTAGTAVTRALTVIDFPVAAASPAVISLAATLVSPSNLYVAGGTAVPVVLGGGTVGSTSAPSPYIWLYSAVSDGRLAADTSGVVSGGASIYDPFFTSFASNSVRVAVTHTGSRLNTCQEGVCAAGTASTLGTPTFTRILLGRYSSAVANHFNGVIKKVCVDFTDSGRCL